VHALDALAVLLRDTTDDLRPVDELRFERTVRNTRSVITPSQHLAGDARCQQRSSMFLVTGSRWIISGAVMSISCPGLQEREGEGAHLNTDRLADGTTTLVDLLFGVISYQGYW
jgi:hypothetical protein